jgi:hypothetical protein
LNLILDYLNFRGKNESSVYNILNGTILKNIKQHPDLLSKIKYQNFIKKYIIKFILDESFDIPLNDRDYIDDLKKLKKETTTVLRKFQEEFTTKSILEDFL